MAYEQGNTDNSQPNILQGLWDTIQKTIQGKVKDVTSDMIDQGHTPHEVASTVFDHFSPLKGLMNYVNYAGNPVAQINAANQFGNYLKNGVGGLITNTAGSLNLPSAYGLPTPQQVQPAQQDGFTPKEGSVENYLSSPEYSSQQPGGNPQQSNVRTQRAAIPTSEYDPNQQFNPQITDQLQQMQSQLLGGRNVNKIGMLDKFLEGMGIKNQNILSAEANAQGGGALAPNVAQAYATGQLPLTTEQRGTLGVSQYTAQMNAMNNQVERMKQNEDDLIKQQELLGKQRNPIQKTWGGLTPEQWHIQHQVEANRALRASMQKQLSALSGLRPESKVKVAKVPSNATHFSPSTGKYYDSKGNEV